MQAVVTHVLHKDKNLLLHDNGNTGRYRVLSGKVQHFMSPSFCNIDSFVSTCITHVNYSVAHRKIEIFRNEWIKTDHNHILNRLPLLYSVLKPHCLGWTPYRASRVLNGLFWTLGCLHLRVVGHDIFVEMTFPLYFDLIPCSRYPFESCQHVVSENCRHTI